jgi:hypothetical protein
VLFRQLPNILEERSLRLKCPLCHCSRCQIACYQASSPALGAIIKASGNDSLCVIHFFSLNSHIGVGTSSEYSVPAPRLDFVKPLSPVFFLSHQVS